MKVFPTSLRRFTITTPTVDQPYAASLALNVFGLSGQIAEDGFAFTVVDASRTLLVHKASGQFQYEDTAKVWNPDYVGPTLNREGAIDFANVFLAQHNLLPPEAMVSSADEKAAKRDDGTSVVNHWMVSYDFEIDALSGIGAELKVPVAGASIHVQVGNGEIIGVVWNWRHLAPDFGPAGVLPAFDQATALSAAQQMYPFLGLCPATTTRLIYSVNMQTSPQAFAAPSYVFLADGLDDGVVVPATNASPRGVITSPAEGSEFVPCAPLTLSASVFGGTPPYSYTWYDPASLGKQIGDGTPSPSEVLGSTNPLSVSLDGGNHTIRVAVTDANGLSWTHETSVHAPGVTCVQRPARSCRDPIGPDLLADHVMHLGWSFGALITSNDGLRLNNVSFLGHYLAHDMELPFYWFQNVLMSFAACELKHPPGGNPVDCVSHLEDPGIRIEKKTDSLEIHACYCVDHLPKGPASGTMTVCQVYIFWGMSKGCDPIDVKGDCVAYKPLVEYWYWPPPANYNPFIRILHYQRFDFDVPLPPNRAAFYQDFDSEGFHYLPDFLAKGRRLFPLGGPPNEGSYEVADFGGPGIWDNYHQREGGEGVRVPGCVWAGNWNCAHVHWRWGKFLHFHGGGNVLVPSTQNVLATVVRFHDRELDPLNFMLIYLSLPPEPIGDEDSDLVLWNRTYDVAPYDEKVSDNDWFFK